MKSPKFTIEVYGLKGMKSIRWCKKFKDFEAAETWMEKNDAEMQGARELSVGEQA